MDLLAGLVPESRSLQLARQMRQWREALDRNSIAGRAIRQRHVSQEEAAVLCGLAVSTYRALEKGDIRYSYTDDTLDRVATFLRLSDVGRSVLYHLATGKLPSPKPASPIKITATLQAKLDCQPWPAYVIDPCWNVTAFNAAALRWFPHLAYERNAMRAVATDTQLRSRLVDWDSVWLPRAIALLKGQLTFHQSPALNKLAIEISNLCPQARHWLFHDRSVWTYEDGDTRELYIPDADRPTTVSLSADVPSSNYGPRYISVMPTGGYVPQDCQLLLPAVS